MADDTKRMNVLYSSDDNYAQHMGVSIYSLLRHNAEFENIRLYVIDNDISPENRDKLREMVSRFSNAEIMFLPFLEWKEKLRLNMSWDISISSYARLFVGEMLPETVDRVLYADCDMIVCEPLRELWNTPLDGKVLAAVQDSISADTKAAVGLQAGMRYFNAGLLLIDLAEWRARKMGERCMSFIDGHGGNVVHHDQGVLNGVLMGDYVRQSHDHPLHAQPGKAAEIFSRGSRLLPSGGNRGREKGTGNPALHPQLHQQTVVQGLQAPAQGAVLGKSGADPVEGSRAGKIEG